MSNLFDSVVFSEVSSVAPKATAKKEAKVGDGRRGRGFGLVNSSGVPGPELIHSIMANMMPRYQEDGGIPVGILLKHTTEHLAEASVRVYLSNYSVGNKKGNAPLWERNERGMYRPL